MSETTLRQAACRRDLHVGAAVAPSALQREPLYAETLAREYSLLTPENCMKFGPIHPQPDEYAFGPADALVEFAAAHEQLVHGHTLVWHQQLAGWVTATAAADADWQHVLEEHIGTVVGRYRGRIAIWDVINEALNDGDGRLRQTPWLEHLGPRYLDRAFTLAHAADPAARLFYNDYGAEGMGLKSQAVYDLVRGLLDRGVPVHGVGLQLHIPVRGGPPLDEIAANMERLHGMGLEVQVTELDVRLPEPFVDADLERQAEVYRQLVELCLAAPNCTALITWGFSDAHSWVPGFFQGWGRALPFDAEYRPKPAHAAMLAALASRR